MLNPKTLLSYFADCSLLGGGPNIDFLDGADQWHVSFNDVLVGRIPDRIVTSIFEARHGSDTVPVVFSLRSLSHANEHVASLLLIAGELDGKGMLAPFEGRGAWIPSDRIATDAYHSQDVVVCDMDTYRAHQSALSTLPNDGSWTTCVTRAIDLFDSVSAIDELGLADQGLTLESSLCVMRMWRREDDAYESGRILASAAAVLDSVERQDPDDLASMGTEQAISHPLLELLDVDGAESFDKDDAVMLPDDPYLEPKVLCGVPDHLPPLSESDHKALAAIALRGKDVLALATPKGTNWHAVALAAMANKVTEHALRGDAAPTIACIAPTCDLEELQRLLGERPVAGLVALSSRWLPRIDDASQGLGTHARKRTLGSLTALCIAHGAQAGDVEASHICLTRTYDCADTGSAAAYAEAWYGPSATTYFLDCVSSFLGKRMHSTSEAAALLSERLRLIDQDRCDLIDAYADVCKAYELHVQREGIEANIVDLRKEHTKCKERLRLWEQLAKHNPTRHKLFSRTPISQASLIEEYAMSEEHIALGQSQIIDVCVAYRAEIERIEEQLDRLRGASANLSKRMSGAVASSKQCMQLASRLRNACGLTTQQATELANVLEARTDEVSLHALDLVLDQTVRSAEFWLALHVYECQWLELCAHEGRRRLWNMDLASLSAWAGLCPFGLVRSDFAVSTLSSYGLANPAREGDRVDLALVLRSDLTDVARGMAVANMTDQLVAFGSRSSLGPGLLRASTFDELRTTREFGEDAWQELMGHGFAVSQGKTFFSFAIDHNNVERASLEETACGRPEIDAFRSELIPEEPITPCGTLHKGSAYDYPPNGILPDLSYVLVPDSSWEQHGLGRTNVGEARAVGRWLRNHAHDIQEEYAPTTAHPLVIVVPFSAQANIIAQVLGPEGHEDKSLPWDIRTPGELRNDTWPIVVLCTTCGPSALAGQGSVGANTVLSMAASAARDSLVIFCAGSWLKGEDPVSASAMRRALRVGRLFSSQKNALDADSQDETQAKESVDLRSTPLALSALLSMLAERGRIARDTDLGRVAKALADVGLIEVFEISEDVAGSRPTAAGREVGIMATTDRYGVTSCVYSDTSVALIASLVENLE